ncbi:hypothetical protein JCM17960_22820 [Magnetospira thiophila]
MSVVAQMRQKLIRMAVAVGVTLLAVSLIFLWFLHLLAFEERRDRLGEMAYNLASLAGSIAKFDLHALGDAEVAWNATVAQLRAGFNPVLTKHMEVVLARRVEQQIEFVWRQKSKTGDSLKTVNWDSILAGPMHRALDGQSGVIVSIDYDGREVLAAYAPVPLLGLGLVLKEDLSTIREPYLYVGMLILCTGFVLFILGRFGFSKFIAPIVDVLSNSEQKFRDLVVNSPDIIWEIDAEGSYSYICPRCEDILGYAPDELIGKTPFFHMSPEEAERVGAIFGLLVAEGLPFHSLRNTCRHKDGHEVILESSGNPLFDQSGVIIGYRGVGRDITDQRELEKSIADREEELRMVLASTSDGIYVVDIDGICTLANPAAAQLLGYDGPENLVGQPMHELIHQVRQDGTEVHKSECRLLQAVREGRSHIVEDEVFWKADGRPIRVRSTVHPIEKHGIIIGGVASFIDLTDRIEVEKATRQTQKMDALGTLAGGIAHDVNNMLLPIIALTGLTLKQLPAESRDKVRLEKVLEAANSAKRLISQILAFSRKEESEPTLLPIVVNNVVRKAVTLLESTLPSSVELEAAYDATERKAMLDQSQMETVLINLATNAVDAMAGNVGKICFAIKPITVAPIHKKWSTDLLPGKYVMISVSDTGCGMSEEVQQRLFDPFFTTKAVGEGTGLGLSMVYGIIDKHNGKIFVDSAPGKGSTFEIVLPEAIGN